MNRAELVEILASKNDLSKAAANAVLETLIDTIQTAVKKGDAVQLVGFGTFKSAKRAARTGKNPSTGAALKIPASTVPKFVAGAKGKAGVEPKAAQRKAITGHRSEIAALKREVKALTSQLKATQRQVKAADAPKAKAVTEETTPKKSRQIQFDAQVLIDKRAALGITQKQMAQLLGASSISVYKWETGHVHPRAAQLERISEVLKLGKRKALALLNP